MHKITEHERHVVGHRPSLPTPHTYSLAAKHRGWATSARPPTLVHKLHRWDECLVPKQMTLQTLWEKWQEHGQPGKDVERDWGRSGVMRQAEAEALPEKQSCKTFAVPVADNHKRIFCKSCKAPLEALGGFRDRRGLL